MRRVAVLTAISGLGLGLLAPLAARSATPELEHAERLLDAVEAPVSLLDRGTLVSRMAAQPVSAETDALAPIAPESLATAALPVPASAPMEATLHAIPTPTPAPRPVVPAPGPFVVDEATWDRLAQCESGGNWSINTGNGYYGGLQFNYSTWHAYGGGAYAEYPHQATREQQIAIAEKLYAARGFQPWPACREKLGLP